MSNQDAWTKWEHIAGGKITWTKLWKAHFKHFTFILIAEVNTKKGMDTAGALLAGKVELGETNKPKTTTPQ